MDTPHSEPILSRQRRFRRYVWVVAVVMAVVLSVWWYRSGEPLATLRGHRGPVYSVAFSPDGTLLASGGADCAVRLWNLTTFRQQAALTNHPDFVMFVTFSPDGKLLATNYMRGDNVARLWDVKTHRLRTTFPDAEAPDWFHRSRLESPDGMLRVDTDQDYYPRTLTISDAASGRKLVTLDGHPDQLNSWSFSADGSMIATAGGYTAHPWPVNPAGDVRIWDVRTGRLLAKLTGFWGAVSDVEFSPDGKFLATASYDGTIRIWSVTQVLGR